MSFLRQQLTVYSPVCFRSARLAVQHAIGLRTDPRPHFMGLVRQEYRADRAVLCGSGTEALQIGLGVASELVGGSSAVAIPAFTCFDVASAGVGFGADIALYDVNPCTLAPDLRSLERIVEAGARIVVVSPLYGVPVDWDEIERCLAPYGAVAIEDAAQGHGASWLGRPLGSLGKLSVLSFGRGKGWTGCKGGALLFRPQTPARDMNGLARREPGIADELTILFSALALWGMGRPSVYKLPASIPGLGLGETRYRDPVPPGGMTRAAAAMLEATRELSRREAAARRTNAAALKQEIRFGTHVRPVEPHPHGTPGFLRLPLRLSHGLAGFSDPRRAIRLGIAPGYPTTLAALPQVQARLINPGARWPGAEELARELVTLPTHSRLSTVEREQVLRLVNNYPSDGGSAAHPDM